MLFRSRNTREERAVLLDEMKNQQQQAAMAQAMAMQAQGAMPAPQGAA